MWTVTALDVGSNELEKSVGTYLTDCGKKVRIALTSVLIEEAEGGRKVLVDTGPHSPGEEKPHFSPMIGERPPFLGTPFEIMSSDYGVHEGLSSDTPIRERPGSNRWTG